MAATMKQLSVDTDRLKGELGAMDMLLTTLIQSQIKTSPEVREAFEQLLGIAGVFLSADPTSKSAEEALILKSFAGVDRRLKLISAELADPLVAQVPTKRGAKI